MTSEEKYYILGQLDNIQRELTNMSNSYIENIKSAGRILSALKREIKEMKEYKPIFDKDQ